MTLSRVGSARVSNRLGDGLVAAMRRVWAGKDLLRRLGAGWTRYRARKAERRALVRLSLMPAHRLRDMGYDPETLYYALKGTRDEVPPIRAPRP